MSESKRPNFPAPPRRGEVVIEKIETEADRQLKQLLKRQLNTVVLHNRIGPKAKRFHTATVLEPSDLYTSGERSLKEYNELTGQQKVVQDLRDCGLSTEEVIVKLQKDEKATRFGAHPDFEKSKLSAIEDKIKAAEERRRKEDQFSSTKYLSRHALDFEKSITHDKNKQMSLEKLTTRKKNGGEHPDDPINHLDQIWKDIQYQQMKEKQNIERHSKQYLYQTMPGSSVNQLNEDNNMEEPKVKMSSCSDTTTKPVNPEESDDESELESDSESTAPMERLLSRKKMNKTSQHNCERECYGLKSCEWKPIEKPKTSALYRLSGNKIVRCDPSDYKDKVKLLQGHGGEIPDRAIVNYRLSLQQIREIPRFKDYHEGTPSNKLFVKNLSPKVTEEDLVSLFQRFQIKGQPPIEYRLLTGRMKGQAFVKFHDVEQATKALEFINGYDYKGKPIIIQYGRVENKP